MICSVTTSVFRARSKTCIRYDKQCRIQDLTIRKSLHTTTVSKRQARLVGSSEKRFVACEADEHNNIVECSKTQFADVRRLAHFPPDIWADSFVNFSLEDCLKLKSSEAEVEPLKEQVREWLADDSLQLSKKMTLIDTVERLGVYYYYDDEIEDSLRKIYEQLSKDNFQNQFDLCETATHFRVLRQHGYKVPCDMLKKFTNEEGKFKESLSNDIRGILSLYEAAHLRIHGDHILDEALPFTKKILDLASHSCKQASHALKQAYHFGILRDESWKFISFYQEDERRNETLLRFAKIEYNRLQLIHRQELTQIARWWRALDLEKKLPYARHRYVECSYYATIVFYEPQYSFARILFAKLLLAISVVDDTYDAYGTYHELELLTRAFERWDPDEKEHLPEEYMKVVYGFVLNTFDEYAMEMSKRGKSFAADYTKDRMVDLIRRYYKEVKWLKERYSPTFEEYIENAAITTSVQTMVTGSMMGMDEIVGEKHFQHISQSPKSIRACEVLGRLAADFAGHQKEEARGCLSTSIECYKKDHNKSKEETLEIMKKMMEELWKDMNEELLIEEKSNVLNLPRPVLSIILNLCRMSDAIYGKGVDHYSHSPQLFKQVIHSTYVEPFSVSI